MLWFKSAIYFALFKNKIQTKDNTESQKYISKPCNRGEREGDLWFGRIFFGPLPLHELFFTAALSRVPFPWVPPPGIGDGREFREARWVGEDACVY